jgi:hypothetical protein
MQPSQNRSPKRQRRDSDNVARDLDAERVSSDRRIGGGPEDPEYYRESPPVVPPDYARYSSVDNRQFSLRRPSVSKRPFRTVARFALAVLVGVGATLGWQSYGDQASMTIRAWAPSLAWLLPVSVAESPVAAVTLPELVEQLKPMSLDIAITRRTLEQLAANQNQLSIQQDQIAQNVATLQQVEQESRQGVHPPPRKPLSSTGQPLR